MQTSQDKVFGPNLNIPKLSEKSKRRLTILFEIFIVLVASLPLFMNDLVASHDLRFHLFRISGIATGLLQGTFPVKLYPDFAFSFGYPAGVCYGDVFLYPPAILYAFGLPLEYTFKLFVLSITIATAAFSYHAARTMFQSRLCGMVGSALWTLSIYRLFDMFVRASVGEYLALCFLPLIALGIYRVFFDTTSKSKYGWITLGLAASAVIQSHFLSVIMFLLFAVPVLVVAIIVRKNKKFIKQLVYAFMLCIGLSAWFIVPFIDYYFTTDMLVNNVIPTEVPPYTLTLQPAQLFSVFQPLDSISIGWSILLGSLILIPMMFLAEYKQLLSKKARQIGVALFILGVIALTMTTWIFPWGLAENPSGIVAALIRRLGCVQFPWRYLGIGSFLLVQVVCIVCMSKSSLRYIIATACIALAVLEAGFALSDFCLNDETYDGYAKIENEQVAGLEGGEYLPKEVAYAYLEDVNLLEKGTKEPIVPDGVTVSSYEKDCLVVSIAAENSTDESKVIRLPLFWQKYFALGSTDSADCNLIDQGGYEGLELSPHSNVSTTISFREPLFWKISYFISLICICLLFVYLGKEWRGSAAKRSTKIHSATSN